MTTLTRRTTLAAAISLPLAGTAIAAEPEGRFQFVEGDPNAKVTVVEYASLTCPHCGHFHRDIFPEIKKNFIDTGKVRWVMRHFPLDQLAMAASILTACAPNNNGRKLYDTLYANQDTWAPSQAPIEPLKEYAQVAGMTGDAVETCLRDKELIDAFRAELNKNFETHNVEATPAFFIGSEDLQGAPEYAEFAEILNKHIAAAK